MSALDRIRRRLGLRAAAPPLACIELVEIVTDYLEGLMPPVDRVRFDTHLERCDGCHVYLEQMRQTIRMMGRLDEERISPLARDALLQVFRGWRQE